jgi:hypothetical protein
MAKLGLGREPICRQASLQVPYGAPLTPLHFQRPALLCAPGMTKLAPGEAERMEALSASQVPLGHMGESGGLGWGRAREACRQQREGSSNRGRERAEVWVPCLFAVCCAWGCVGLGCGGPAVGLGVLNRHAALGAAP